MVYGIVLPILSNYGNGKIIITYKHGDLMFLLIILPTVMWGN